MVNGGPPRNRLKLLSLWPWMQSHSATADGSITTLAVVGERRTRMEIVVFMGFGLLGTL